MGRTLPLVRTKSGHIMLPISVYRNHYSEKSNVAIEDEKDDTDYHFVENADIHVQALD